jgi:hypothetical protein
MIAALASPALAQSGWSAMLFIDPYPSPYLSDWELNPNISSLTIVNSTGAPQTASAVYRVTNSAGRVLASGRSDPQSIPPDEPRVYTSFVDIAGTSSHDAQTETEMVRTGRLPEGVYQACVTMTDGNNFIVAEECAEFTIVYPDPPFLLAPGNGEVVTTSAPFLQWTPLQLPAEFQLRYIVQVAEVQPNQTPDEALNGPVPHFVEPDAGTTNFQYPLDAPPLEEGRTYAWRVVTQDQNGYAATSNGGASETYVFHYDTDQSPSSGESVITLSMSNGFDHEPDDGTVGTRSSSGTQRGIDELCANWDAPAADFVLTTDSPIGFKRFAGNDAVLFQEDTTQTWWIRTVSPNGRRDVLISGGCDRSGQQTIYHWIASRNTTLQERVSTILSNPLVQALPGLNVDDVNFGMIILSKGKQKVDVPAEFAAGVEFLGDRELEVAPGLNLYSEIDLEEFALWPLFQEFGFTEKRITVYGFLGWDASWSFGGAVGSEGGQLDVDTEHKYLVLRAALPERTPNGLLAGMVESMGFELEIEIGDETGRAWSDKSGRRPKIERSLEVTPKLKHVIKVNDDLKLEGSIALTFARETSIPNEVLQRLGYVTGFLEAPKPSADKELEVTISYGASGRLALGPRGNVHLEKVQVDVKFPFLTPRFEQEFVVSGELGVGNVEELIKVGLAFKRTNLQALHDALGKERKKRYDAGTKLTAAETGECAAGAAVSPEKAKWCAIDARIKAIEKTLAEHAAFPDPSKKKSDWEWKLRASVGHMSLGDVLALIKEGGP